MVSKHSRRMLAGVIIGASGLVACKVTQSPSKGEAEGQALVTSSSVPSVGKTPSKLSEDISSGQDPKQERVMKSKDVTLWYPKEAVRLSRPSSPDELIDGIDLAWVELDVREAEIRLVPPSHESSTIIFRAQMDLASLKGYAAEEQFGLDGRIFRHISKSWNTSLPIEVELHYTDRYGATRLADAIGNLKDFSRDADALVVNEAIIAEFESRELTFLNLARGFELDSAYQKSADGTRMGFSHSDLETLREQAKSAGTSPVPGDTGEVSDSQGAPPVKERTTKVVFWHPEKPIVLEEDASEDALERGEYGPSRLDLNAHEVEIRLGAARHETYTIIIRAKVDKAFLDECIEKTRFGFLSVIFSRMQIPWDAKRKIDLELHYSRTPTTIDLLTDLSNIRKRRARRHLDEHTSPDPVPVAEAFEPDKVIIETLAGGPEGFINHENRFELRSARQTLADGTVIGFDYLDAEALGR